MAKPQKPETHWQIDPDDPITFDAELNADKLQDGKVPANVQTAVRTAIRHAVIGTLEAHGLLERSTPVSFKEDTVKPPVDAGREVVKRRS